MSDVKSDITAQLRADLLALTNEHAWRLDHGGADTLHTLYTADGELLNLPPRDLVGGDALRAWGAERVKLPRISRHIETNHRLWWDGGVLHGSLYASVYRCDEPPAVDTRPLMVGDYEDVYAQEGGQWRIRRRTIRAAFRLAR